MKIRYAKDSDIQSIKSIWDYCFDDEEKFVDYYFNNKYKSENTVVVDEGEDIVSSLQLNQYKINLNNKIYDTSYVVGVSTFPQVRGKGYMKNIMEFSLRELYKKNQLVSILMPIDYRLYRKYGYEHCYDQLEYNIQIDDLKKFKTNGILNKAVESDAYKLVDISKDFLSNLNGNIERDEEYYKSLFKEIESENGHIYIHKGNDYDGYIIYFLNGETMFIRELYYKNIDSLKSILKFVYNHNTQCKKVNITAPINDKIRFILDNPKTCEVKIRPFMMGRIINLKKYLESLYIQSDINISENIYIKDEYIKENNGLFNIKLHNSKLEVSRVDGTSENYFDINTITQLAFSYIDIDEALTINNKNINDNTIKLLNEIFKKKENYINEYV